MIILTHASKHFEAQVRVLERSIKKYEPDALFLRYEPEGTSDGKNYIQGLPRQRFRDVLFLLESQDENINRYNDIVILIGADCVLFDKVRDWIIFYLELSSSGLNGSYYNNSVLLSPHITRHTDFNDGKSESDYYKTGMINGDFIVFRKSKTSMEMLQWLIDKDTDCNNPCEGKFYEQTYLTMLPFLFKEVKIVRDIDVNVACYNLNERPLVFINDKFFIGEKNNLKKLKIFHFSGYEIDKPEQLTRYAQLNPENTPYAVQELLEWYALELKK